MHWKGYYGRLTAATVSAETPSRLLKASRWAGNVGELAKQRSPISSLLFAAFTLLPYYRVYRSAFTPLGHLPPGSPPEPAEPPSRTLQASTRCEQEGGKWGEAKTNSARRGAARLQLQSPALPAEGACSEATAAAMLRQMHSGRNRA